MVESHLSAELLSPLLQQHKVGKKSPRNPSEEVRAVHHSLFPCLSNGATIPGNQSNCYNKRNLAYEVFKFFASVSTILALVCQIGLQIL